LSAFVPSRRGHLLALLAYGLGLLAVVVVLVTLFLVAVDGHPEGLLAAGAGAAVPPALLGGWRLRQRARAVDPAYDPEVTPKAEVTITKEETAPLGPPTRTIVVSLAAGRA
jgi:hypothetical protein